MDGFFQFLVGKNIIGYPPVDNRITSFFNDESILGSYLIKFLPFIYLCIFQNLKNQKILIYLLILLLATSVLIFLSGERAAFFLMILLTLYFIFMIKELKFFEIIFFISIFSMIFIIFFNENIKSRYLHTIKELKKSDYWVNNEILDRNYTIGNYYIISPTHNNYYIQLLAETGFIGFITIFIIFLFTLVRCLKILFDTKQNSNLVEICLLSFFLINLWPLTSTGNFFNNWISILIYMPISFYLFYKDKNEF